jgi:hypothetical protein
MAFIDQAPTLPEHMPAQAPEVQYTHLDPWGRASLWGTPPAPPQQAMGATGAGVGTLLLLGLVVGGGYLLWRSAQEQEDEEEAAFIVEMYLDEDDKRYAGGSWDPRYERHFDRRSDAEMYREQQEPYFDRIVIREVSP